jgi:ribosomal protein S18 acetylase RimI-like enzyme
MFARAFADDPYVDFLTLDDERREARMIAGWLGLLRYNSNRLSDSFTTTDRAGAAIWLPPDMRASSIINSGRLLLARVHMAGWRRLAQITPSLRYLDHMRARHVPSRHYYLLALGVEPTRQGTGIGSALMRPILDRVDREGLPAYLETAHESNLSWYERHGFRVVKRATLPNSSVDAWFLRREPASAG